MCIQQKEIIYLSIYIHIDITTYLARSRSFIQLFLQLSLFRFQPPPRLCLSRQTRAESFTIFRHESEHCARLSDELKQC